MAASKNRLTQWRFARIQPHPETLFLQRSVCAPAMQRPPDCPRSSTQHAWAVMALTVTLTSHKDLHTLRCDYRALHLWAQHSCGWKDLEVPRGENQPMIVTR